MADEAKGKLDRVITGDVAGVLHSDALAEELFDCVICADVLEHLADPWAALTRASGHLSRPGVVVASIPNIRHYSTLLNLLFRKHWPCRDRGIHDAPICASSPREMSSDYSPVPV